MDQCVAVDTPEGLSVSAARSVEQRVRTTVIGEVDDVEEVEVRATETDAVVCPLLASTTSTDTTRAVETESRRLLSEHDVVESVERCTVHYHDTLKVDVDANVVLKRPDDMTVSQATNIAKELRELLERSENIDKANIFLDLNVVKTEGVDMEVVAP